MARDEAASPLLVSEADDSSSITLAASQPRVSFDEDSGSENPMLQTVDKNVLPEESPRGRFLTWQSAYIIVISRVIGTGIFATPGAVVRSSGSIGLSMTIWMAGAVFAGCGLAILLEYGCMLPRSGGEKVYLEFVYRRPRFLASAVVAVTAVLLGFTASNCIVFSQYTLFAFDIQPSEWVEKALAVGLLTVITIIHSCVPKVGIVLQNILGWIKVTLILFMIFAGLFVVGFRRDDPGHSSAFNWDELWKDSDWSWGIVATSIFKVNYSYAGLSTVNLVLDEVKNPVKTLRSVCITAFWTTFVLYGLINVAYFIVVPIDEIKSSGELVAALFFERTLGPRFGKIFLPMAIALSGAGNVMVVTYALARLNQEIARQGFLPFSNILASSRPFNAPMGGMIVHYIPSLLVITLPPSKDAYSFILDAEGYPRQFIMLALGIGLIWLRYTRPDLRRPFKAWWSAIVLILGITLALIAAPFFPPKTRTGDLFYAAYALVGGGVLVFAVLYWYLGFVLIPRWQGYKVEEISDVLEDGTSVTRLVKVYTAGNVISD